MALPYFFEACEAGKGQILSLSEETGKHCIQVLRMKTGDRMHLTNGRGTLFTALILQIDKRSCNVTIESVIQKEPPARKVSLAVSLVKNTSRFEWMLEKATEIGVSEIIPLVCKRTERQHFRQDRMQHILIAAMLQSQQAWLPILHSPIAVDKLILESQYSQKLVAHCEEDEKPGLIEAGLGNQIQILIGPEGDFTPEEISLSKLSGFKPVSLGNTRLRTETAAVVAAALLLNI